MVNVKVPAFQESEPMLEALRPSTHSSSCRYEMTGTPRACADAMIASASGLIEG